jgi:hypothetical protein
LLSHTADETVLIPDDQPDADNKVCPTMKKSKSGKVKAKHKSQKDNEINQVEQQSQSKIQMLNVAIKISHPRKKSLPYSGTQLLKIFKVGNFQMTIVVKSFAGANCSDMEDYLKPVVRKEPENIILHVGTNDLNKSASPDQIAQGIINLGIQINQDSLKQALLYQKFYLERTSQIY